MKPGITSGRAALVNLRSKKKPISMKTHSPILYRKPLVLLMLLLVANLLPDFASGQSLSTPEALDNDWEWIRENPKEWRWSDGVLRLRTQPGGVWGPTEPARNVLVSKSSIKEKGSIEARIGLEDPIRKWEQAGLLVYGDDDHFVKLIVEFIEGAFFVVMAWEQGEKNKVVAKIETGLPEAWLRLEVERDQVRGLWRKNAESAWAEAAVCEFPEELNGRFAIFTQTGPEDEVRWATAKGVNIQ